MLVSVGVDKGCHGFEEQAPKGVWSPLLSSTPPVGNTVTVEPSGAGCRREFPSSHHS